MDRVPSRRQKKKKKGALLRGKGVNDASLIDDLFGGISVGDGGDGGGGGGDDGGWLDDDDDPWGRFVTEDPSPGRLPLRR